MAIVVDLDDTLSFKAPDQGYEDARVNYGVANKLKEYRERGEKIIIYTARNMRTYKNNVGLIAANTLPIIKTWLIKHNIPHDEIHIGKPWCEAEGFYVDDKAIRPNEFIYMEEHNPLAEKYYEVRKDSCILDIKDQFILKYSNNLNKMNAETAWYEEIPKDLKQYAPIIYDSFAGGYRMEKIQGKLLSDLYLSNDLVNWENIFSKLSYFLQKASRYARKDESSSSDLLFKDKTFARIDQLEKQGFDVNKERKYKNKIIPSIKEIAENLTSSFDFDFFKYEYLVHGDLHFGNIFLTKDDKNLKFIDPRGLDSSGNKTIYGNQLYEFAKISHSVIGMYDYIIGGKYIVDDWQNIPSEIQFIKSKNHEPVQNTFRGFLELHKLSKELIWACTILLFISMTPLHSDRKDRQLAFLGNANRLYSNLF